MGKTLHLVSPIYPSSKHPALGTFIRSIANGLEREGWTVRPTAVGRSELGGVFGKIARYIRLSVGCMSLIYRPRHLVYIHLLTFNSIFLYLPLILRRFDFVINIHGSEIHSRKPLARLAWPVTRRLFDRAALVISPSKYFVPQITEQIRNRRIAVSPSGGVDAALFCPTPESTEKNAAGGGDSATRLLFVSRLVGNKGWRLFLNTVARLRASGVSVTGTIIGDGPERGLVTSAITDLALKHCVQMVGAISQPALPDYYRRHDLFFFGSEIDRTDTLGLVCLEAIMCGTPVIARDSPLTAEYITPGTNGVLVPGYTPAAFASAVKAFILLPSDAAMKSPRTVAATAHRYHSRHVASALSAKLASI